MARTSAGQLSFSFDPPPPVPASDEPVWFRMNLDKKGWSYGEIGIMRNDDGTWSISTSDSIGGYCGHGGPFWGEHASFEAALTKAILMMRGRWADISVRMNDSCCGENHRRAARKGVEWMDSLAAEYGLAA